MEIYEQKYLKASGYMREDHVINRINSAKQHLRELKQKDPKKFQKLRKADILNRINGKKKNDILCSVAREE